MEEIATGLYQSPKIPKFSEAIPAGILQIHSMKYRNPSSLPSGAVLVVGTGQSGAQIAQELYQNGRKVYLSVGSAGRVPWLHKRKSGILFGVGDDAAYLAERIAARETVPSRCA